MALYRYVKKSQMLRPVRQAGPAALPWRRSPRLPLTSSFLMLSGVFMILWVLWPIASFELFTSRRFVRMVKPIPDQIIVQALENTLLSAPAYSQGGGSVAQAAVRSYFPEADTSVDYTKASNWFPKVPQKQIPGMKINNYTITIPKLGIKDAKVIINGDDLNKSLIHYGGTSLPGEYGKAVIFGHSTLPALFNPRNYTSIFSTLPTLKEGDEIFAEYDGITYRYVINDMRVTAADDVSVLSQKYDTSYLCLVTCVPPGTYWKRLVVCGYLAPL